MRRIKVSFTRNGIIGGVLQYRGATLSECVENLLCDDRFYGTMDDYPLEELEEMKKTLFSLLEWLNLHDNKQRKMNVVSIITDEFKVIYPR